MDASLENQRLLQTVERERQEERQRRLSVQQSLLNEYKKHMTLKAQRRNTDDKYEHYYEKMEEDENQKQE